MTHVELFTQFMQATAIAAGLFAWALATVLFAPRAWYWRASVAVVSGLATMIVHHMMLGEFSTPWWVGIGCGVVGLSLLTSSQLWRGLARVVQMMAVGKPSRMIALIALLLVGLGWGLAYQHYEQKQLEQSDAMMAQTDARNPPRVAPSQVLGVTDLGQTISLEVPIDPAELSDLEALEETSSPIQQFQDFWIRRGPPDDTSNCHGWVFTNGKYNIAGQLVSTILKQNNYVTVKQPQTSDLVVYRNTNGDISHTGIVRAVLGKNDVLVESKWGRMGVYLHPVEKSCYGKDFEYYRSERGTHVITMRSEKEKIERAME